MSWTAGSQYFNAETGELSNQKELTASIRTVEQVHQLIAQTQFFMIRTLYGTTDKDIGTCWWLLYCQHSTVQKKSWKMVKSRLQLKWQTSIAGLVGLLLSKASLPNYVEGARSRYQQTYDVIQPHKLKWTQAALWVQKRKNVLYVKVTLTGWVYNYQNFAEDPTRLDSTSENLDNSDHCKRGALYNNDSRTAMLILTSSLERTHQSSQWGGKHNPKYTKDT